MRRRPSPSAEPARPAAKTARRARAPKDRQHTPATAPAAPPARAAEPRSQTPVTLVRQAADEIVAAVPRWVWGLIVLLLGVVAGLARRMALLAGRRRRDAMASCEATVRALAAAVEAKDACTAGHLERVQRLGLLLAARIVPEDARSREMAHGFLLHDVGKLAVPDAILNKPGRLDRAEIAVMRSHADAGAAILDGIPGLERAIDVVRHHHERWDGEGYPAGLAGEAIPVWARIFSVVDTLDAMTSDRPYAERRPLGEALDEVRRNAGRQFDPEVVGALMGMRRSVIAATLGLEAAQPAPARREPALAAACA